MTKKNQFIDIGTLKVKVVKEKHTPINVMVTHNGYQWSAIGLENKEELRVLWQTIGRYLKEDV